VALKPSFAERYSKFLIDVKLVLLETVAFGLFVYALYQVIANH